MKNEKINESAWRSILRGTCIGFFALVLSLALFTLLVSTDAVAEKRMPLLVLIGAFIAAVFAGVFTARAIGRRRLIYGLLEGAILFLITVVVRLCLGGSGFPDGWTLFLLLAYGLGGAAGGVISGVIRVRRR